MYQSKQTKFNLSDFNFWILIKYSKATQKSEIFVSDVGVGVISPTFYEQPFSHFSSPENYR